MDTNVEREIERKVKAEDFPDNYRRIVDAVGVPWALEIVKASGGITQYIPMYDSVTAAARDRLIIQEFTGGNYKDLALKYGISEVWVRTVLDKQRRKKSKEAWEKNQNSLDFGEAL